MREPNLRSKAIAYGRELARQRGEHFTGLFDDSLRGDLARLEIRRRLLREHPESRPADRELAIKECLTP